MKNLPHHELNWIKVQDNDEKVLMKILIGIDMTKLERNLLMGDTLYNFCFIKIGRLLNEAEISAKPINDITKQQRK